MDSVRSGVIKQKREGLVKVSRACPEKVYVELRLPEDVGVVNQIIFTTVSHDQGYSGEARLYGGTYEHSFTWFVVAVITPGGHDRVPRRVLQYNVHASKQFLKHVISWKADSADASIREWVNAIRKGDTIQIIPKAQYAAWINFVQEAEIELHHNEGYPEVSELEVPRPILTPDTARSHNTACYRPLDNNTQEIRLVYLEPGNFDEPISCSFAYTSLPRYEDPTPTYETLSYCWGDTRRRCDISLSISEPEGILEYTLSITAALYAALKNLRPQSGTPRILWVDSICIDQANVDERSSQVALMADIYRKAERVIVWLGEGNEITKKAIQTINTISSRYEQGTPSDGTGQDLVKLHDPLLEGINASSFVDEWPLFELPWFRHTWVVQEIFNARAAIVCCGQDTLTWSMVLRVNKCIGLTDMKANSSHKAFMPPIYEDLFESRVATDSPWYTEAGILEVLVKGLNLDATDPRDKIFAMLQFGRETRGLAMLPQEIIPDYRRSTSEVFSSFTKWWIVEHRSLRILSAIHALEGRTWQENFWGRASKHAGEQPTWSWWYRGHSNWSIGLLGLSTDCPYRAAADTKPDINLIKSSRDPSILLLTGIKVGIIEKTMPYPYYRPPPKHEDLQKAYVGIFDPLNFTGKWINQMTSNHTHDYMTSDDPTRKLFHFDAHLDYSKSTAAVKCHSNCFFSTREGLTGLCPFSAKPGDLLVILYGGNVPYVLREHLAGSGDGQERDRRYEFVGECYLQGYMEGRGIEEQKEKGIPVEAFTLV